MIRIFELTRMSECWSCGSLMTSGLWFSGRREVPACDECLANLKSELCVGSVNPAQIGGGKVGRHHPTRARVAAATVKLGSQLAAVMAELRAREDGMTSYELAHRLTIVPNQVAARVLELRERGLVTGQMDGVVGVERATTPGNTGQVWTLTDAGLREAARLAVLP